MDYVWLIFSGVVMGLIAAVPVGPVNIICIRRTFAFGPLNGFLSGLGAALGDGVFAVVTGLGLTWVAQLIEGYAALIELVGGMAMVFFGIKTFLDSHEPDLEEDREKDKAGASLLGAAASTFALTVTNPATLLFFTGMFAGLGGLAGAGSYTDASFVVAGVVLGSTSWWLVLTTVIGLFHARVDAKRVVLINRFSGLLVAIFGLAVLGHLAWGLLRYHP
ncbi:MAG: LysE family transporter [Alphaproteobacteria bacterium]|nr:LysE family transporter [Alphaproteobacteria bacterium]